MKKVIFACVHNAGRSQMAAAFFNSMCASEKAIAVSAGTAPAAHVHPVVVVVMQEAGIDLATAKPTLLTEDLCRAASLLITMGCGENCPYVPGLTVEDWKLEDPKGQSIERVRILRDEIRARIKTLIAEERWA